MKTKAFLSVSRIALLALTCVFTFGLAACGGDDDETGEGPIDEILSVDTTPISFTPGEEGTFYLYDYTPGGQLVEAHTFTVKWFMEEVTVNLRRGKHRLLWLTGIHNDDPKGFDGTSYHGIHYYPESDELHWYDNEISSTLGVRYCEQDITVTDHIPSAQSITFSRATSCVQIISTDFSSSVASPNANEQWKDVGNLIVKRRISSMSLRGQDYELASGVVWENMFAGNNPDNDHPYITAVSPMMLCPISGLSDVEAECVIVGRDGQTIPTTPLPNFSLRRGYFTLLEGPLFSGSTSDWKVTMYQLGE